MSCHRIVAVSGEKIDKKKEKQKQRICVRYVRREKAKVNKAKGERQLAFRIHRVALCRLDDYLVSSYNSCSQRNFEGEAKR